MQGRSNHGDSSYRRSQSPPEHFVAGSDCDNGVELSLCHQACQTPKDREIPLSTNQATVDREFSLDLLAQRSGLFQADHFGGNDRRIHPPHHVDQQSFRTTNRHAGDDERTAQRTLVVTHFSWTTQLQHECLLRRVSGISDLIEGLANQGPRD